MIARAILGRSAQRRPLWLMTLADLALLMVGFLVLLHSFDRRPAGERGALARGMRTALGNKADRVPDPIAPVAMEADRIDGFAPGSAVLPHSAQSVARWLKTAAADPRSYVVVTGRSDETAADRAGGSGAVIAAARADAVAAALIAAGGVPPERLRIAAAGGGAARRVDIAITYQPD